LIIRLLDYLYGPTSPSSSPALSPSPLPGDLALDDELLADIEYFAMSPLVYSLLKRRGQLHTVPRALRTRLEAKYTESLFRSVFIRSQTERLLHRFEQLGIEAIPLKGPLFASKYFGDSGARETSDIDLLVREQELPDAADAVRELGFEHMSPPIPGHFHRSFSKPLPHASAPLTVELHWDLLVANTSKLDVDQFWQQSLPLPGHRFISELSDRHAFYMICLHSWRHNLNSLRYLVDIVQMIHSLRHTLDYSWLFQTAAAHRTFKRVAWTLEVVYGQFPHLQTLLPLPQTGRTNLHWDYGAIRGSVPITLRHYVNVLCTQFLLFDSAGHGLSNLGQLLRKAAVRTGK
jgi:hypothetical protein